MAGLFAYQVFHGEVSHDLYLIVFSLTVLLALYLSWKEKHTENEQLRSDNEMLRNDIKSSSLKRDHDLAIFREGEQIVSEIRIENFFFTLLASSRTTNEECEILSSFEYFYKRVSSSFIDRELQLKRDLLGASLDLLHLYISENFFMAGKFLRFNPDIMSRLEADDSEADTIYYGHQKRMENLTNDILRHYRDYREAVKNQLYV